MQTIYFGYCEHAWLHTKKIIVSTCLVFFHAKNKFHHSLLSWDWVHFGPFLLKFALTWIFLEKGALSAFKHSSYLTSCPKSEKINEPFLRKILNWQMGGQPERWTEGQTDKSDFVGGQGSIFQFVKFFKFNFFSDRNMPLVQEVLLLALALIKANSSEFQGTHWNLQLFSAAFAKLLSFPQ